VARSALETGFARLALTVQQLLALAFVKEQVNCSSAKLPDNYVAVGR
jgi:hypothetical protein